MEYTINRLSKMAGVTTRTLRYYDQIGLLPPLRMSASGYRIYGKKEVDRLQQILFYRQMGMELSQIVKMMDDPKFDTQRALEEHLLHLQAQRETVETLIATAQKTLDALKGGIDMDDHQKFEGFIQEKIEQNERTYGKEIREKYGDEQVERSNALFKSMTEEKYKAFEALRENLNEALCKAMVLGDTDTPEAEKVAQLHKEWLGYTLPQYSAQMHRGLVDMYMADERFAAYYEKVAPGATKFLHDAVYHWVREENEE